MNRRNFLTTASVGSAALAFASCNEANRQAIDYSKHPKEKENKQKTVYFNKNKKQS